MGNCQVAVAVHLTTEAESMPLDKIEDTELRKQLKPVFDRAEAAAGILLLAWPHPTLAVVAVVVGALSILAGGIEIASALSPRHSPHRSVSVS